MSDTFTFHVPEAKNTIHTSRCTVNSLFDPLGFLALVTIEGRELPRPKLQNRTHVFLGPNLKIGEDGGNQSLH